MTLYLTIPFLTFTFSLNWGHTTIQWISDWLRKVIEWYSESVTDLPESFSDALYYSPIRLNCCIAHRFLWIVVLLTDLPELVSDSPYYPLICFNQWLICLYCSSGLLNWLPVHCITHQNRSLICCITHQFAWITFWFACWWGHLKCRLLSHLVGHNAYQQFAKRLTEVIRSINVHFST